MKKILFTLCVFLGTMSLSARTPSLVIDYSMSDFSTGTINGKVIGSRLAKMLTLLQTYSRDFTWSNRIAAICCEQKEQLDYVTIDRFKIKNISKHGDVIMVTANVRLAKNAAGLKNTDIHMTFDKGISDSQKVNDLFSDLFRYTEE
jgi:hypothetical protein